MAESQIKSTVENQIVEQVAKLDRNGQLEVLSLAKTLAQAALPGEPGTQLLRLMGAIPLEDLNEMETAIQDGCEKVDPDEW